MISLLYADDMSPYRMYRLENHLNNASNSTSIKPCSKIECQSDEYLLNNRSLPVPDFCSFSTAFSPIVIRYSVACHSKTVYCIKTTRLITSENISSMTISEVVPRTSRLLVFQMIRLLLLTALTTKWICRLPKTGSTLIMIQHATFHVQDRRVIESATEKQEFQTFLQVKKHCKSSIN